MKKTLVLIALAALTSSAFAQSFVQGFDTVGGTTTNGQTGGSGLEASGWFFANLSSPRGLRDWGQGNDVVFNSHQGAPNSYIVANFENTGSTGTISNWMFAPTRTLNNGDTFSFAARTNGDFNDRLQVRLSTSGSSTNVGTTATSTGDFSTLLLDINPTYNLSFPTTWTEYNLTVSGLSGPTSGRFAFRYFVEDAGFSGANSDYMGIDTVSYQAVPEPMTLAALGLGALVAARRRRKQ
ncbi:MAG: PEP-CTERM sorting domain-containing protein [Fimbriimonadaceae bacterium]|nr:PEP-CTERM sorting domain-containing protein [Fimbriimonadaceae bacterium]